MVEVGEITKENNQYNRTKRRSGWKIHIKEKSSESSKDYMEKRGIREDELKTEGMVGVIWKRNNFMYEISQPPTLSSFTPPKK